MWICLFFFFFFMFIFRLCILGMNTTIKMLHFLIAFYQEVFDDDMTHFTGGFKLDCLT